MKYIRFKTNTLEINALMDKKPKILRGYSIMEVDNDLENIQLDQIKLYKKEKEIKINIIDRDILDKEKEGNRKNQIKINNRKGVEDVILKQYPYWKQINNIYSLLLILKPVLVDLTKDNSKEDITQVNNTYNMIESIFGVLGDYNSSEVFDTDKYKEII